MMATAAGPCLPSRLHALEFDGSSALLHPFIRIVSDGTTIIRVGQAEMGQGVYTAIPQIIADEMGADWDKIRIEPVGADLAFANRYLPYPLQYTGTSSTVRANFDHYRTAAATAREMLVRAAAARWQVDPSSCRAGSGQVLAPDGRSLGFGELCREAGSIAAPAGGRLKPASEFVYIGRSLPRTDTGPKVDGSAVYGLDVRLPGMLFAVVVRAPRMGAVLRSFDDAAIRSWPGVKTIRIPSGVAVVAPDSWTAIKARAALETQWSGGSDVSTETLKIRLEDGLDQPGLYAFRSGTAEAMSQGAEQIEATYFASHQAHACAEPMSCVADVRSESCNVWSGFQLHTRAETAAAEASGLPKSKVRLHTTLLGGGFGRRLEVDFVTEAVQISKAAGAPILMLHTREDDIRHDFYRPAAKARMRAAFDAGGQLQAVQIKLAAPSIFERAGPIQVKNGLDPSATDGLLMPYAIPNMSVEWTNVRSDVPVGRWRSVGHSYNAFFLEQFIDEMAFHTRKDPLDFRRSLLASSPRLIGVLDKVAEAAEWNSSRSPDASLGLACQECFSSFVAMIAEVQRTGDRFHVRRIIAAVDCGLVVNPDLARSQVEGAVIYGLSQALFPAISVENGIVLESNYHDYPVPRMKDIPRIDVHFAASDEPPGGAGEVGTPCVAPAIANALFALTRVRRRSLPVLMPTELR